MTAPVVMWGSLRWRVLVWSCSEPGEWTYEAIADDLEEEPSRVLSAVRSLRQRGLLGYAEHLSPTENGFAAMRQGTMRHAEN